MVGLIGMSRCGQHAAAGAAGAGDVRGRLPMLLEWVQHHGGWLNPALELREGQYGASVFAVQPVRRGDVLVRTPQSIAISGDSVLAHTRKGEVNGEQASPIVAAVARMLAKNQTSEAISLFIAQQRRQARVLKAASARSMASTPGPHNVGALTQHSWLHPFIFAMPEQVANALAFSAEELRALRGSQAEVAAREMQQSAARQFAHLCLTEPALFDADCADHSSPSNQELVLAEDILWATSMV
jgi:hypothetical protein